MAKLNTLQPPEEYREYVEALDERVRNNTALLSFFQDCIRLGSGDLSKDIISAIKRKAWQTGFAVINLGIPQVVKFDSMSEWASAYVDQCGLGKNLPWLFRYVTSVAIGEESIEAALMLLDQMTPGEIKAYVRNAPGRPGFIAIAQGNCISQGPEWNRVVNALENASTRSAHRPAGNGGESPQLSPSSKVDSKSKEALRRRIVKHLSEDDCPEDKVSGYTQALDILDQGGTYRVAAQAAGMEIKNSCRIIYVTKDVTKVGDRLLEELGADRTAQLIAHLSEKLTCTTN